MSKNTILVILLLGLVAVLFVVSKITVPNDKSNTKSVISTKSDSPQAPVLDREIDINDVAKDPAVYSDLTLTLEGKIDDWVTKNAFSFTAQKTALGSSGESLPIISRSNFKLPADTPESDLALGEVANIKVTGKVVIFDRATLEKEWGVDLNDKLMDKWNKDPVLLVDSIEKI